MKTYSLNVEKTKEVYDQCRKYMAMKECYNNVFKVVTRYMSKFKSGEWKVAYGYISLFDNLLGRHCFIIDENGEVIDPTLPIIGIREDVRYFVFRDFENMDKYLKAIAHDDNYPALTRYLRNPEERFIGESIRNGYVCIG